MWHRAETVSVLVRAKAVRQLGRNREIVVCMAWTVALTLQLTLNMAGVQSKEKLWKAAMLLLNKTDVKEKSLRRFSRSSNLLQSLYRASLEDRNEKVFLNYLEAIKSGWASQVAPKVVTVFKP